MKQPSDTKSDIKYYLDNILWSNVLFLSYIHISAVYGIYLAITSAKWQTIAMIYILGVLSSIGIISGAHRYATHKAFKANRPLRLILMLLQTISGQKSMIEWTRDHYTHHKFEGTDADEATTSRGLVFAHIGWLVLRRHPECEEQRNQINVEYLRSDPILLFQHKYYEVLVTVLSVLLPTLLPHYLWSESLVNSYHLCVVVRYVYTLQLSLCGNSIGHSANGSKPYDKSMSSVHNDFFIYTTLGGTYHNFHHVFPWDYSESEYGWKDNINLNTAFIDFFAYIGWAYDLKRVSKEVIDKRKQRTGGPQHFTWSSSGNPDKNPVFDWLYGIFISALFVLMILISKAMYRLI